MLCRKCGKSIGKALGEHQKTTGKAFTEHRKTIGLSLEEHLPLSQGNK